RLNGVPIHSFADAQYALDRAPKAGPVAAAWQRGDQVLEGQLALADGWRRTDISWRASLRHLVASARLHGPDLTAAERKALGLSDKQLAFRQRDPVTLQAKAAGILPGDVIVGVDDKALDMDVDRFLRYISSNYLIGERVTVNLLRD